MQSRKNQIEYCNELKTKIRETYNNIGKVFCPILNTEVVFNAKGFHHLLYKPDGTARDVDEVIYKLKLFPLAIPVIKNALGISEERSDVEVRVSRKKGSKIKKGKIYALTSTVGKRKHIDIRVIILKIGNGNFTFLSIMKN